MKRKLIGLAAFLMLTIGGIAFSASSMQDCDPAACDTPQDCCPASKSECAMMMQ